MHAYNMYKLPLCINTGCRWGSTFGYTSRGQIRGRSQIQEPKSKSGAAVKNRSRGKIQRPWSYSGAVVKFRSRGQIQEPWSKSGAVDHQEPLSKSGAIVNIRSRGQNARQSRTGPARVGTARRSGTVGVVEVCGPGGCVERATKFNQGRARRGLGGSRPERLDAAEQEVSGVRVHDAAEDALQAAHLRNSGGGGGAAAAARWRAQWR
jgi:hypothetical protein